MKVIRWTILSIVLALVIGMNSQASENVLTEEEVYSIACCVGEKLSISPEFLTAIAYYESRFDPDAKNGDCTGLMQVSNKWHEDRMNDLEIENLFDPKENIIVASDYLLELFEKYEDPAIVLMVYNGDSTSLKKGVISEYANNILELSESLERKYGK